MGTTTRRRGWERLGFSVGERGIDRPIWRPDGTKFSFCWPQGVNRRQRDYLARLAKRETGDDPSAAVRWLQRNAWRHLGPRGMEYLMEKPKDKLNEEFPEQDRGDDDE